MINKNVILFVNSVPKDALDALPELGKKLNVKLRSALIHDLKRQPSITESTPGVHIELSCDFDKLVKVEKVLLPIKDELLAVVCRGEAHIASFSKLIPHVPYVRTPTEQSLTWATDKISMRQLFNAYDKKITPRFTVLKDATEESVGQVKEKVGFPLVIKPASLAASLLVSICFHEEEFDKTLKKVFRKIKSIYKENKRSIEPKVLVEQFMEGEMYSVDAYVSTRGTVYFCPLVHVKTGRSIGFDDFFGYQRMCPTTLKKNEIESAELVASKSIHAIGLRNVTAHVELMKTDEGWKVIELAPRVGGFRHRLYELSFGINHAFNDICIRIPKKPIIPKKQKGHACALKFFAQKEGVIKAVKGLKKIQGLESFVDFKLLRKVGEKAKFAKHGGKGVCDVILFHKSRSDLLADIRRVEQAVKIQTK